MGNYNKTPLVIFYFLNIPASFGFVINSSNRISRELNVVVTSTLVHNAKKDLQMYKSNFQNDLNEENLQTLAMQTTKYDILCEYTFIAKFGGRHEDLSLPENSCPPWAKPEGDMIFLGGTNLHVSRLTGQLFIILLKSWSTTLYGTKCWAVRHDRETRRLEGDMTFCLPSTWRLLTNHISTFVVSIIWGIIISIYWPQPLIEHVMNKLLK